MRFGRLTLGGRLDRYVGALFAASYSTALLLVVGLVVILDLASNLDFFEPWEEGGSAPTLMVLRYYALNLPFLFLQVAPFVTVVAGLFTVVRLGRHNETVAALNAGVSAQRVLLPLVLGGAAAAGLMFWLREASTEHLGPKRDALLFMLEEKSRDRVHEDVWLRDRAGNVVRLGAFRPAVHGPAGVVSVVEDVQATVQDRGKWQSIAADEAVWAVREGGRGTAREDTTWLLSGGLIEEVGEEAITPRPIDRLPGIEFTPSDVLVSIKARERPLELSFGEVRELARRDPDNVRYQTLFHYHLTFPLANLVLLLVAVPFVVGQERGRGAEGLAIGCLLCLFYFAADFVTRSWGMEGGLGPVLATWLPVLAFGSLGVVLWDSMRT